MSTNTLLRGFFGLIISGMFAWIIFDQSYGMEGPSEEGRQRYRPYISGLLLPGTMLALGLLAALHFGPALAGETLFKAFFGIVLHLSAYNVLLLLLLPLLRRRFSARACAALWLLPNYLYFTVQSFAQPNGPALVLQAPGLRLGYVLAVWLIGFAAVMVWKCVSHLAFRRRILKDAVPVTDPAVLAVWEAEKADARFRKPKFRLVTSPAVTTPLSIGLTVVLPRRDYTEAELHLLLRHELIHIARDDASNKFFMVFCTALCWFNPLMWIAMRKSAEDLELSCDETVLLGSDGAKQRQYAALLLNTAGDSRGFTTCLSASATSLRYRLKQVMAPRRKHCGALLVGLVFFLLFMSCGYVALAYDSGTGAELLFLGVPEDYSLAEGNNGTIITDGGMDFRVVGDEAALLDYLSGLELCSLTGNYTFEREDGQRSYDFHFAAPAGLEILQLCGNTARLIPLHGKRSESRNYYVPGGIDEAYLESLFQ